MKLIHSIPGGYDFKSRLKYVLFTTDPIKYRKERIIGLLKLFPTHGVPKQWKAKLNEILSS